MFFFARKELNGTSKTNFPQIKLGVLVKIANFNIQQRLLDCCT